MCRTVKLVGTAALGALGASAAPADAATFTVNSTSGSPGNGNCGDGTCTLPEAVGLANTTPNSDDILFSSSLSGATIALGDTLEIAERVRIDATALAERPTLDMGGSSRAFYALSVPGQTQISGLRITGSYESNDYGGAIFAFESALKIEDCRLEGNAVNGVVAEGGAIFGFRSNITIEDSELVDNAVAGTGAKGGAISVKASSDLSISGSQLRDNSASTNNAAGGAIYADDSSVTIVDSALAGNSTKVGGNGGAIHVGFHHTGLVIENSALSGNEAAGDGGAIHASYADVQASDSVALTSNSAGGSGGAVSVIGADASFQDSTISGNDAGHNGGAVEAYLGSFGVRRSAISGNTALRSGGFVSAAYSQVYSLRSAITGNSATELRGGAIQAYKTDVRLEASTLSGNSAAVSGGAAEVQEDSLEVRDSTVTANSAGNHSGGLYADQFALENSIVAGNSANAAPATADVGGYGTSAESLIGAGDGVGATITDHGGTITGQDPRLLPLADNGGPTKTHALHVRSPAIDSGQAVLPLSDQRGFARGQGKADDMGAFEQGDFSGPGVKVRVKGKARAGKPLKLRVRSDEQARVIAKGIQSGGKFKVRLKRVSETVPEDKATTFKLKPAGKRQRRKAARLRAHVRRGGRAKAKLRMVFTDRFGNRSTEKLRKRLR